MIKDQSPRLATRIRSRDEIGDGNDAIIPKSEKVEGYGRRKVNSRRERVFDAKRKTCWQERISPTADNLSMHVEHT